jgi:hypothetical protein
MKESIAHPKTQFDKYMMLLLNNTWQGWQFWNQTFEDDDWEFDVEDIREVLDG